MTPASPPFNGTRAAPGHILAARFSSLANASMNFTPRAARSRQRRTSPGRLQVGPDRHPGAFLAQALVLNGCGLIARRRTGLILRPNGPTLAFRRRVIENPRTASCRAPTSEGQECSHDLCLDSPRTTPSESHIDTRSGGDDLRGPLCVPSMSITMLLILTILFMIYYINADYDHHNVASDKTLLFYVFLATTA
jgi:hypothetical protein